MELRCRALLADGAEAGRLYARAVQLHREDRAQPFERARTELLYETWLRRDRRRNDAREPLHSALEIFERLRAKPWAERAGAELRAAGEARQAQAAAPDLLDRLTPQELNVVRLAAKGLSNRDIGARLFVSPRTVGYHLYNAYPKLGVASRTEIRRQLELPRRELEVLRAVGGLERVARHRKAGDPHPHHTTADGHLCVRILRGMLAARWDRQADRPPQSGVQVRPVELVIGHEIIAVRLCHCFHLRADRAAHLAMISLLFVAGIGIALFDGRYEPSAQSGICRVTGCSRKGDDCAGLVPEKMRPGTGRGIGHFAVAHPVVVIPQQRRPLPNAGQQLHAHLTLDDLVTVGRAGTAPAHRHRRLAARRDRRGDARTRRAGTGRRADRYVRGGRAGDRRGTGDPRTGRR
ncbi:helix-turn-helix transcriptional regulator [Nonomuraea sp. NPDC049504]|uniref:helix-turn-helix transcriptional regulator n=1 Tax=Nonomuraea sp. NPDC049504 TaxID=3154729 RepID=UPI0034214722